ncbi:MAG: hypothetical protein N2114_06040 [Candidatus Goldbacteria bacterium]|nr:hypothetical protein [Candidatus Goldiibacteriota bacterium]
MQKNILLVCWSKELRNGKPNPKNPPIKWWEDLVFLLKEKNLNFILKQIGYGDEKKILNIDEYLWDKNIFDLVTEIKNCYTWISVDTYFQHWAWYLNKPGIVIWSQSDPEIFGHVENINLLKDKKYLRDNQFDLWENAEYNEDAFIDVKEVLNFL